MDRNSQEYKIFAAILRILTIKDEKLKEETREQLSHLYDQTDDIKSEYNKALYPEMSPKQYGLSLLNRKKKR